MYCILTLLSQAARRVCHSTDTCAVRVQSNYCLKIIQDAADGTVATGSCYRSLFVLSGIQCDANGKVGRAYLQVQQHGGIRNALRSMKQ